MKSFIDYFIEDLLLTKRDLSAGCVVFPTRRAGVIFKKKFAGHISKPAWLPAVYSIDDFISALSSYQVADATHLVLELFTIYQQLYPEATLEKFFPWGEMLLKDFNETDMQLADAEKLFSQVRSLKEIELLIGVDEEETARIREFWKLFSKQELSRLENTFLSNWQSLHILYKTFRNQLGEKGIAYSGMAAREVAGKMRKHELSVPWDHVYFAGFYALSNAERVIIDSLMTHSKATVRWDADQYYTGDKMQEAGRYFRKKQLAVQEETLTWTFDYFLTEKRTIHLLGVPLNVGQARYAGVLLDAEARSFSAFDDTALVIPDEKMLMPVLHSLPDVTDTINVTMGYPLKGTPLDELTCILKSIREQHHTGRNDLPVAQLISLFENKYISGLFPDQAKSGIRLLKKDKRKRVPASFFSDEQHHFFPDLLLNNTRQGTNEAAWLASVYFELLKQGRESKNEINKLETGLLKFFYDELDKLSRLVENYRNHIDFSHAVVWKMVLDLIRSLRVPFSGEPVKGLQIMGFLETRNLDFNNLLVLSVNEEVMPGNTSGNSYIPFALRKAYGLPTFEEQDAIYAYHFYRLLQRAKNVYLFYNTEAGGLSSGEMSRYILQIAYEMKKKAGDRLTLTHRLVGTDLQTVEVLPIIIKKDQRLQEQLHELFIRDGEKRRKWSATAFSSYITCSLQFYLKYIAGIKEPDEVKEEIDPAVFGNIVHSVMERFYSGHSVITREYIQSLLPEAAQAVDDAIRLEFPSSPGVLTGKNSLLKSVLTELVKNILSFDLGHAPFTILGLEKTFDGEIKTRFGTVSVAGKIDRLDEHNGLARIIDYKTGKDEIPKITDVRNLIVKPDEKAAFQLLFYSLLLKKSDPLKKFKAGLFSLRSRRNEIDFLNGGDVISSEQLQEFEEQASALIASILDPEVDFIQTTDTKRCTYCPYKDICSR